MNVIDYIIEEVRRQGHDIGDIYDGGLRVHWMLGAWLHTLEHGGYRPSISDVINIGTMIEPGANADGVRKCHVRVGLQANCPPPERVMLQLEILWSQIDTLTPLEFYKAFEEVHPFRDGNGRTGKILLNWLNGTLEDPIFPPADLWGREVRNP